MVKATIGGRVLQILGILVMCLIWFMIIDKGFHDVSALVDNYPDDFWRAFAKYALNNLAGG